MGDQYSVSCLPTVPLENIKDNKAYLCICRTTFTWFHWIAIHQIKIYSRVSIKVFAHYVSSEKKKVLIKSGEKTYAIQTFSDNIYIYIFIYAWISLTAPYLIIIYK